jgi:hypothetical protein
MSNASLQRGRQGLCEEADEPAAQAERDQNFRGVGHPLGHPLQLEVDLAVAGRGTADSKSVTGSLVGAVSMG